MQGCFTTTVILRYFPKREYTHGYSGLLYGHFMNKVNKRNPTILRFPNFNKLPVPVIGVIVPVFINLLVFTCFFVHLSYVLLYAIRQFFILALQNELHCSKKNLLRINVRLQKQPHTRIGSRASGRMCDFVISFPADAGFLPDSA